MRRVVIESPFAAPTPEGIERNLRFLRACMADCLKRNEAPYASHALYTQPGVLDDKIPEERKLGIEAGFAWKDVAEATVVYGNLGVTAGMQKGIDRAKQQPGHVVELRMLGGWAAVDEIALDVAAYIKAQLERLPMERRAAVLARVAIDVQDETNPETVDEQITRVRESYKGY